ncbi:MAG TPA: hypothetical protein VKB18_10225 [Gemmatimonadota bacterium]|nr:hypothetical protein [Gemmatimonadota bacterium]
MGRNRSEVPPGVVALGGFFVVGALMAGAAGTSLLLRGGPLEAMWRINPRAREDLAGLGSWAVVLMLAVAVGCALAAGGLWMGKRWGHRLAVGLIGAELLGGLGALVLRGDLRTLVGLPIAALLLTYLLSAGVRAAFHPAG